MAQVWLLHHTKFWNKKLSCLKKHKGRLHLQGQACLKKSGSSNPLFDRVLAANHSYVRADIRVSAPTELVFAAIAWDAAVGASCSATLCTEMIFIAGEERAASWCSEASDKRELFDLPEAHALITTVFVPLMQ
jgi:hypothetical protein